jgi:uncharacterized protein YggE
MLANRSAATERFRMLINRISTLKTFRGDLMKQENAFALLLVAAIVITGLGAPAFSNPIVADPAPQADNVGVLTTTGTYTATADPDRAEIVLGVEEQAGDAAIAQRAVADKMARIRTALTNLGIGKDSIETMNYDISPRYDWEHGRNDVIGYTATQTIRVKLTDLNKVGQVVDAAGDAGANRVDYVSFTLSDAKRAELKKQALTQAAKNAREQADAAAAGLGVKVTSVRKIDTNGVDYQPYYRYYAGAGAMAADAAVPTEIEPSSVGISATVTVEFGFE